MIRSAVTVLALCAFLATESSADEPPPGLNPRIAALGGLILTFKTCPLRRDVAEVVEDTLENAGFRLAETFPKFCSWYARPHKWPGPSIRRTCSTLMLDGRICAVLESCEPNFRLKPLG